MFAFLLSNVHYTHICVYCVYQGSVKYINSYFVIHYSYSHYTQVPTFVYIVYYQGYVSYIKVYFFVIHFCCPLNPHLCILCSISGICSTDEIEWNRNGDGVIDFYPLHFLFPASREINLFFYILKHYKENSFVD